MTFKLQKRDKCPMCGVASNVRSFHILPAPDVIGGVFLPHSVGRNRWGFSSLAHCLMYGTAPGIEKGCKNLDVDERLEFGRLPYSEGWRYDVSNFDFICASSPCEEFSIWGMANFHPNPAYPAKGIRLFNHTREILEASGIPWVMENVRPAQKFVGEAVTCCGPFALWGPGVPPLMPQGITKGFGAWDRKYILTTGSSKSKRRREMKAKWATIPPPSFPLV